MPKTRLSQLRASAEWQFRRRCKALIILGGVCKVCGLDDYRCLQIDHINGDGHKERGRNQTGFILAFPELARTKYQVLCANHNWIKRFELGETRKRFDPDAPPVEFPKIPVKREREIKQYIPPPFRTEEEKVNDYWRAHEAAKKLKSQSQPPPKPPATAPESPDFDEDDDW